MKRIYVPDIECDSCVKRITRALIKHNIKDFRIKNDYIDFDKGYDARVIPIIKKLGFRADTQPFDRKTIGERLRHIKENKEKYKIERIGLENLGITFLSIMAIFFLGYVGLFRDSTNFLPTYGLWLFYLAITTAAISTALWHFYAYKIRVTCMIGMMVGMTFGMQTGMMLGAIIGATNGFFIGCMAGMLIATAVGIITGRCCGVMGVMEGMMAGIMGGTMGPMISVMMYSDNLNIFMPFFMVINLAIIVGLSYMLYEEVIETDTVKKIRPLDRTTLVSASIIIATAIAYLMIYGPKSALIG